jgi:nitrous oxide reductase accessory protein NosL
MNRRKFIALGLVMTPLAAALSACGKNDGLPEGMLAIVWDRDTCTRCSMIISDRRFAVEMRGGPTNAVFKFDDIGCAVTWTRDKIAAHPWMNDAATRLWVADVNSRGNDVKWLEARAAHYITKTSPMAYNQGAVAQAQAGSIDFATMSEHVLAKGM